jgi:UDP-N-acetyl-D-glucosamine dehydrogenase
VPEANNVDFAVIGLGYVGLPLAQAATAAGLTGLGLDSSASLVDAVNRGECHVDDLSDEDIQTMLDLGFAATTDPSALQGARIIVICVPTPLAKEGGPDLRSVMAAAASVRDNLRPGTLVILESTTWPGTTEEVLLPLLEESGLTAGTDFDLAFSPERIDPGNPRFGIANTPKVVGGHTATATERATAFYSRFVESVVAATGTREAEMSKLLENTYRQVNIALVNEMAKFSHELGIDFWDVIHCASTKPFGFQAFYPGPGVGGHCIPIDPGYLSHRVQAELGYPFRFVELAQEINGSMPLYVASRAQRLLNDHSKPMRGSRVLLLGITYKPGVADQRESPAVPLCVELRRHGAEVAFYDHFVETWETRQGSLPRVADLGEAVRTADVVLHLQPHDDYSSEFLRAHETPVLDTRGTLTGAHVHRL